jgi:hypothetical protein
MAIILGGFTFTDYAIPEQVPQGGEHALVVHKLIGGNRVIDAMGPDDSDITWHGRFQGPQALGNAQTLDSLRKAGAQLPLIIDANFYTAVVRKFEYDYQRPYQILYRITVVVVTSQGGASIFPATIDSLVAGDITAASALVASFSAAA